MYGDPRPLFIVTAAVIVGLVGFVAYVLVKMKDPWVRSTSLAMPPALKDLPIVAPVEEKKDVVEPQEDKPKND